MTKLYSILLLIICAFAFACSSEKGSDDEVAIIETDYGEIRLRFYPDVAPRHVEHFKKLARAGFYDGLAFHRVVPGLLIQGGDPTTRSDDRSRWGMGEPGQETVPAEFSPRPFVRGTLGAARKGGDINSATSQFFICLRENPSWNGQYTVFGEVIEGLDAVEKISNAPREGNLVRDKIVMRRVRLERAAQAAAN